MTGAADALPMALAVDGWPPPRGYSDVVVGSGRLVVTAGQVGWDPRTQAFASEDMVDQVRQALENVAAALSAAGAEPRHVVRLTWYIVDRESYMARRREIGAAYRAVFGKHFPAMAVLVVAGLLEPLAKVEIEATALV